MQESQKTNLNSRIEFLKQIKAFADLQLPQLQRIAESLTEEFITINTVIFNEGDRGDKCYFIVNGEVLISTKTGDDIIELARLTEGTIFGETSILLKSPRNATAKTISNTVLLVLDGKILEQVTQPEGQPPREIIKLLQSRCRPKPNPDIEIHQRKNAENEAIYLLKNLQTGDIIEIPDEGLYLWRMLDGNTSLEKIVQDFLIKYPDINSYDVVNMVINLAEDHFITIKGYNVALHEATKDYPWWLRALQKMPTIMEIFVTVTDIDSWISKTYAYVKWYFTPLAQLFMASFLLVGWIFFLLQANQAVINLHLMKPIYLFWIYPFFFLSLFIHEFSHAYLTKHFGYTVRAMGFGWFWLGPAAFCDTTDSLLAPKIQRLAINLVGIYTEAALAGLVVIISFIFRHSFWSVLGWLYALLIYINIIRNLDPIIDLDGYYTLQDLTNEPDIREKAVSLLTGGLRKVWQEKNFWVTYRAEIIFWAYIIVFHFMLLPFLVWFEFSVLGAAYRIFRNYYLVLGLPLLVVFLSILTVWAQLRAHEKISQQ